MGDELVTVFVGRCPMGEQCSKKHGILTKKATEEEVRKAIHHHLRTSPYHEMTDEDANGLVELSEVETWTEERLGGGSRGNPRRTMAGTRTARNKKHK